MAPRTNSSYEKTFCLLIPCIVLLLSSAGYADQVFGNFETGLDSWTIAWDGTTDLGTSTTGATLDSHSMTVLVGPGEYYKLQREGTLNLAGAARIAMDITFVASEWPESAWCNVHKIALQDHSTWTWQEVDYTDMVVESVSGADPPALDGENIAYWGPWMGDVTWTISWRLTNVTKSNDFYSLFMALQCNTDKGSGGYYYIDNVRVLTEDVAQPLSRLHVGGTENNKLINEDGNEVTLRGVSLVDVGFQQSWRGGVSSMIDRLTDESDTNCDSVGWYTNVIRMPVVPPEDASYGWPYPFDPNDTDLYDLLRSAVDYCALKGVYAIIDWHDIDDMNSTSIARATEFWEYMAPLFADDTHVIFELFNEPINNDGTDAENWAVVKAGMETLISTVRTYAPHTLLLIGTPRWCQIIGPTVDDPLDDPNVVYVSHIYPWHWINETLYYTTNLAAVAAVHPVILGEWGFIEDPNAGILDGTITNYGEPLKQFIEGLGIGNIAWVSSYDWQPPMYDTNWFLLDGEGYMGCFVKDWLYNGWIATQNTSIALTITRCEVTAGATRGQDSIEASGTIASVPPNLLGVSTIDVNIVSGADGNDIYTEDVNFAWDLNGNRFIWSTSDTGKITLLILNFRAKTFVIKGQNIDLTGLNVPVHLDFTLGDYLLSGDANEAIVNGTRSIPAQLLSGYENTLDVKLGSVSASSASLKDSFYCSGSITVQDLSGSNLVSRDVNVTWADQNEITVQTFTIPAGSFKANGNLYECTNASTTQGAIVNAKINFVAGTFTVAVRNTNLSVTSDVKFGINFTSFDESDNIENLQVAKPSIMRYLRR